jgi:uncharacterized repeat protein (TIGR01451 family)
MLKRSLFACLATTVVVTLSVLTPITRSGAAPPTVPGFHRAVVMPGSSGGSEPSLAISNQGVRYVSWQSPGEFAGSADGVNFQALTTPDSGASGDVTNAVSYSGALYNGQICGGGTTLHSCIYRSLDGGHTWTTQNTLADNHPGASDRPWIDVYPRNDTTPQDTNPNKDTVYLEFHTFSPDDLVYVTVSHDGGATFSPPHVIESDTNADDSTCNTIPGGITVDQDTGAVYALWLSGNDVESNLQTGCNYSQIGPFNKAWVSVSTDGGDTWTSHLAWEGAFDTVTKIGDNADKIFSTITVDASHQVHIELSVRHNDDPVGFVIQCTINGGVCEETPQNTDIYLVTSPDRGQHWTLPFKINKVDGSFFFPWLSAGSAGIVDAVYYSSSTKQPNKPTSVWYVGFSQITGAVATYTSGDHAAYASTPVATNEILLDPNPIHGNGTTGGGICTFGIFCSAVPGSNRGLADVFEVHVDAAGGANVTWTKDLGSKAIWFACQDSGASAFAGAPDLNGCFGQADISVTKTDSPDPAHVGQNLTYTITVANGGPASANGVVMTDTLPKNAGFGSFATSQGSCTLKPQKRLVTCTLGSVASGAHATVTIVVKPTAKGKITNTATATSIDPDPNLANNTGTAVTKVTP